MYISKLILNTRSREVRRDFNAPYEMHRTLAHAFGSEDGVDYRADHGVLFRIEPLHNASSSPVVIVQSATKPEWHELPEEYLSDAVHKSVQLSPKRGSVLAFRLLANPCKKVSKPGQRQGKRLALLDRYEEGKETTPAQEWLFRKAFENGFQIGSLTTHGQWQENRKGTADRKKTTTHYAVMYEGTLLVTEPTKMEEALKRGIGPAKAFGFGLLSLAPLST